MNGYVESAFIVPRISNISDIHRTLYEVYLCLICVFSFVCDAVAHDTVSLSTSYQSILQAREEAMLQASAFEKADHMTGNWWGVRDRLYDSGVEIFAFYNSIFNGNVSGGSHPQHSSYVDDAFFGLKFDLEKLFDWRNGLFVISGINRSGKSLTTNYVGSIYSVQQMVGGQQPFLYQVYLQQKLFENKLRLKLGRFGASDDFNASPFYGYSLNNGINGDIRNVLFNTRFRLIPSRFGPGRCFTIRRPISM
ncbi:MAG: carbohydrate porin [Methylococcaceae bacterium]|nr:carbohydrate porin [Methylococcaceae bacterium]